MKALVTGASSGIGYSIARYLSRLGYDLIVVARRKDCLINLKKECSTNVEVIDLDLSIISNMYKLYDLTKYEKIDILVNNAGVGLYGEFYDIDTSKEISMLNLNVVATDVITKLFLKDILGLGPGNIVELEQNADDPIELAINDKVIARGEVVIVDGYFGFRIKEIVSKAERIRKLKDWHI